MPSHDAVQPTEALDAGSLVRQGEPGDCLLVIGTPEAIDLSATWPSTPGAATTLAFRIDRLLLKFEAGAVSLIVGRQPVSFGTAFFFSPMD